MGGACCMSGIRDSDSRPSAWEANALPTELIPLFSAKKSGFLAAPRHKNEFFCTRLAQKFDFLQKSVFWRRFGIRVNSSTLSLHKNSAMFGFLASILFVKQR